MPFKVAATTPYLRGSHDHSPIVIKGGHDHPWCSAKVASHPLGWLATKKLFNFFNIYYFINFGYFNNFDFISVRESCFATKLKNINNYSIY
jgi:hypothetical protein